MPVLIVNGGEYQGKVVEFNDDRFTLGRDFECDLILNDENVSAEHARIVQIENEYFIQDLSSVNGTTIGGRKIVQQALQEGQEIEIGPFKLVFLVDAEALDREREASIEEVRQRFHTALIAELDLKQLNLNEVKDNKLRRRASDALDRLIDRNIKDIPKETNLEAFKSAVLDAALGLGPLEELLADDGVTEIMVNSPSRIFIEKGGRLTLSGTTFSSEAEVMTAIERIVGPLGRRIDESSPMVDARLSDGSRVNAIIPPLALDGPSITIRKFAKKKIEMSDLIGYGSISEPMAKFLDLAGLYAQNMIISGGTGSGKTTLLNICSGYIPETERIITIEDSAELQLPQEHVVRLETRPPNIEGKGAITIRDLVKNALRMRPDRIVVGECRGGETLDMLQAMNTGHDGSLSTAHANSPVDTLKRLETMVLMSGMELPLSAIRELVFSAVGLIVQITRFSDGSRKVISICELDSLYDNEIKLQEIFKFERTGLTAEGKVTGNFSATGVIPGFIEELRAAGINVDMSIFVPEAKEFSVSVEIFIIAFIICALGYYLVYLPIRNGAGINISSDESKGRIVQDLENMFIFISPTHVGTIKIACMLVLGAVLYILSYSMPPPAPYIFLCIGTALGYFVPEVVIGIMKKKRRAAFAEQLVDGLVLLSNGLRAGFTLQQALEMLSQECDPPISQEVELILREYRLGMDLNKAMQRSSERMEDDDYELAVVAVTIARQLGGNLSEIFDRIVTTVRDRKILAGKVDAMTSQGRIQALVVGCLPYAFAVAVTKVNPELMELMWTTLPGVGLMLAVVVMDTVGYFWVLKTAQVEY